MEVHKLFLKLVVCFLLKTYETWISHSKISKQIRSIIFFLRSAQNIDKETGYERSLI